MFAASENPLKINISHQINIGFTFLQTFYHTISNKFDILRKFIYQFGFIEIGRHSLELKTDLNQKNSVFYARAILFSLSLSFPTEESEEKSHKRTLQAAAPTFRLISIRSIRYLICNHIPATTTVVSSIICLMNMYCEQSIKNKRFTRQTCNNNSLIIIIIAVIFHTLTNG